MRIKRTDLPEQNLDATFDADAGRARARGGRRARRAATRRRSGCAPRPTAPRSRLVSEAEREADIIRGEADAERNAILAEAYGADEEFFAFCRSIDAYRASLLGGNSTMMIEPDSDFFNYLHSADRRRRNR